MNDQTSSSPSDNPTTVPRKMLKPRRLALLASVAGLGMAIARHGPGGYHGAPSSGMDRLCPRGTKRRSRRLRVSPISSARSNLR